MRTFYLRFCIYSTKIMAFQRNVSSNLPMKLVWLYANLLYSNQFFRSLSIAYNKGCLYFENIWVNSKIKSKRPLTAKEVFFITVDIYEVNFHLRFIDVNLLWPWSLKPIFIIRHVLNKYSGVTFDFLGRLFVMSQWILYDITTYPNCPHLFNAMSTAF